MSEPLRPFERRYTPEQTAAVTYAMVDAKPRLTATAAVRAAAEGKLPGSDLPPFGKGTDEAGNIEPIPTATAYAWRRAELDARAVKANGRLAKSTDAEHATRVVLAAAWDELEKTMKAARNRKMLPIQRMKTVREYAATAMFLRKCEAEMGLTPSGQAAGNGNTPSTEQPKRNTEADALARAARKRASTERHEPATHHGASAVAGNDTALGQPDTQRDSVAYAPNATSRGSVANGQPAVP